MRLISGILTAVGLAMTQLALAQGYLIKDLGAPGAPGSASEVHGLNRNGSAVGTWWPVNAMHGSQYAFLYSNGANLDLGTIKPAGYDYAIAFAINSSNQVVGQATASGSYVYHAFLYSNGLMVDLDNTGQNWSSANGLNQAGQIVGEMTSGTGAIHAFLLTNGAMADLGTLPNGNYSSAKAINDLGVIVGESAQFTNGVMNTYAFIYSNGIMSNLGTLGGNYSSARAINNAGQIVGEANTTTGETHAFLYSGGVMADLGTFGGTNSTASAINSVGQVVGYALTANQDAHAFVFNGASLLDLNNFLTPAAGWANVFLTLGYALNDAGQIGLSANWYTNGISGPVTNYHAILLTPPVALGGPALLANGQLALTATGSFGARFVLQSSTDLASWTPLSTNVLGGSPLPCVDPNPAGNCSRRFYRALMLP